MAEPAERQLKDVTVGGRVTPVLRRRAEVAAAERGLTLSRFVAEAVEQAVYKQFGPLLQRAEPAARV